MPESIRSETSFSSIVIVDALTLRRAGIASLLAPWAMSIGLELDFLSPNDVCAEFDHGFECRMIIFNLGGSSLLKSHNSQPIKLLRAFTPETPIVIVSDHANGDEVAAALYSGVQGFIHTDMAPELALQAFAFILSGGSYFPPAAMRDIRPRDNVGGSGYFNSLSDASALVQPSPIDSPVDPIGLVTSSHGKVTSLTDRQREVLARVRQGEPNKQIARKLGMTEGTVKVHVRQIMRKLGASNRTQVAVCASADALLGHNGFEYKKAGE